MKLYLTNVKYIVKLFLIFVGVLIGLIVLLKIVFSSDTTYAILNIFKILIPAIVTVWIVNFLPKLTESEVFFPWLHKLSIRLLLSSIILILISIIVNCSRIIIINSSLSVLNVAIVLAGLSYLLGVINWIWTIFDWISENKSLFKVFILIWLFWLIIKLWVEIWSNISAAIALISADYESLNPLLNTEMSPQSPKQDSIGLLTNTGAKFNFDKFNTELAKHKSSSTLPSQTYLEWLVGFLEGDGSWGTRISGKKIGKPFFSIAQTANNLGVLEEIQSTLGIGHISYDKCHDSYVYSVGSKFELSIIAHLLNGNLVLPARQLQFTEFLNNLNIYLTKGALQLNPIDHIKNDNLPSLQDAWLSGFTEAEGSFGIYFSKGVHVNYSLSQNSNINKIILIHIATLFGSSTKAVVKHSKKKLEIWVLKFQGIYNKNIPQVLNYYDKFEIKGNKIHSYLRFKTVYFQLKNKDHLDPKKRESIKILASKINKFK